MRIGLAAIVVLCCLTVAIAADALPETTREQPSEAMLEFLADLEPMDEETWDILEYHALKDVPVDKEENSE